MSPRVYRTLQALTLTGLGVFLLEKIWSGTLYWYISDRFLVLTLLAAIGFLILAQTILPKRKPAVATVGGPEVEHVHTHDEHGHDHHHHEGNVSPWGLVIVALPVALGLLVPAKPLGASAIANKGVNVSAPIVASGQSVRLDIAPQDRNILDWIRVYTAATDPTALEGQPADVIGFVYQDSRLPDQQFLVGRFTISCCVADALAIGMAVDWPEASALPANSWVRVKGPVKATTIDGQRMPLIMAESIETVPEPSQPYLYP